MDPGVSGRAARLDAHDYHARLRLEAELGRHLRIKVLQLQAPLFRAGWTEAAGSALSALGEGSCPTLTGIDTFSPWRSTVTVACWSTG